MARSRTALNLFVIIAIIVSSLGGTGCGSRVVNRTAERKIREALPNALGPAREYRVHIENAALRTIEGKFANVTIDGDDVQFPTGLLLDAVHIELKDVDIDSAHKRVRHIGEAHFTITISERSLDQLIAGEAPRGESIRKTRLILGDNNTVSVTGERVTLLNVGIPFRLTGPVHLATATRIEIDPRRLDVVGIPISGGVLNFFKSRIESSLDLRQFPVPVSLTAVTTKRGSMVLSGAIDAEALLARAQAAP